MNLEVEREVGELAKLRLFRERVMAVVDVQRNAIRSPISNIALRQIIGACCNDIDAIAKEVGSE